MKTDKKKSPKALKKKCDDVRSLIVRHIGYCEHCGKTKDQVQLHDHHLIDKTSVFFRHNLNNSMCLCARCHRLDSKFSAHLTPWKFDAWFKAKFPDRWKWFEWNRWKVVPSLKINYADVLVQLKAHLKTLKGK